MQSRISILLFLLNILFFSGYGQAQDKFTISGYVKDASNGEELIGATVVIKELPATGVSANAYGFYSITLPAGTYTVTAQYLGFDARSETVSLQADRRLDFSLNPSSIGLEAVEVTGERPDDNITDTRMSVDKIDVAEVEHVPVLMGEKDVIKVMQLRPGVKSAGEGNSGFFVRGGAADQNLILLDEAPVYNASHLLGFFSVFNTDALKDVTLYKGIQPAQYGGRLSSVLDIRMQEGNDKEFGAEGGIGLISSRLKVEGPIVKNKGSFMLSGRRTYADLFLKLSPDSMINSARLYFYDLNLKANYRINDNNRLYLSGYFGEDVLGLADLFGFDWGNTTGTVRWNHLFNSRMFSNTSVIFSNYDYNINIEFAGVEGSIYSRIKNYNLKQDFQYFANAKNEFRFGLNGIYHNIVPGDISFTGSGFNVEEQLSEQYALEGAAYFSHLYKPTGRLSLEYGVRLSSFSPIGPGTYYTFDAAGEAVDSTVFSNGQIAATYINPEPRLAVNFVLNEFSSVKAGYARNVQNLHLLSNSTTGSPTDLWIPTSINVKPEIADQVSLGYFRNLKDNKYEFSAETYYKFMQNQIDFKDGAQLNFNEQVESQLLYGEGRAYGIELFLRKRTGRLNGWIGYTLARSEKRIEGINNNEYYPARQDRTHDVSVVAMYELNKKWTLSASWVYYTGNAVTFPSGKYALDGKVLNYYTARNASRMPDYHRLDLGATWERKKTEKFESSWNFSLYNAYGRRNAYLITFRENPDDPARTQAVQTTLFRWIPSVTYNFKF